MHLPPRTIVALAVVTSTAIWGWAQEPELSFSDTLAHQPFEPTSSGKRVSPESTSEIAALLARNFKYQLAEPNPALPGMDSLERDMEVAYDSWLSADLAGFRELMIGKGATVSPQAEAIVESRRSFYPDISAERWAAMTTEERLRFVWENPDERAGGWHRIDLDRTRSGIGWYGAEQDLGKSVKGRYSVFEIEGRKRIFGEAMRGDRPTVWLIVPIEYNDGVWLETRLTWVWLDDTRGWYPAKVETLGPECRSCLMF